MHPWKPETSIMLTETSCDAPLAGSAVLPIRVTQVIIFRCPKRQPACQLSLHGASSFLAEGAMQGKREELGIKDFRSKAHQSSAHVRRRAQGSVLWPHARACAW